jgi:AraC-like DNA-binding protein
VSVRRRDFWLAAVERYVASSHAASTSLRASEFAEQMNLVPAVLARNFHTAVGIRVSCYLRLRQIERAKELLGNGATAREVAAGAGFGTVRTFYRSFRRSTGMTPTEFHGAMAHSNNAAAVSRGNEK